MDGGGTGNKPVCLAARQPHKVIERPPEQFRVGVGGLIGVCLGLWGGWGSGCVWGVLYNCLVYQE